MLTYKYVIRKIVTTLICAPLLSLWIAWLNGETENSTHLSMMSSLLLIVVPIYLILGTGSSIVIDKISHEMNIPFTVLRASIKILLYIIAAGVTYFVFLLFFNPSFHVNLIINQSFFFRICVVGAVFYSLVDAVLTRLASKKNPISNHIDV